ncbi:ATP-binding cassette domain-containing protein [Hydrogenibacillus schlegelii]|uniref:ABC transporter domain-containing protein n=1 Tax=Hydrogenibacillus schlegelii TaxID=1484 RepID=A0A132MGT0_HYDSH|nr:ATP-binding cassette domain-containing protein [Hydrogenibacillus schlegelii]KWW97046.1 hypothetical protein TR75_10760 [Hydrogenibacillus schlegelii]OAR04510.1 hypothetical protein SA87_10495 [Hydrogenibacillus schlegelii]
MALAVQGLKKSFGAVRAVDGIDFEARPGRIFGLLGANGAGKTTTLRMILGLVAPDAGKIRWQGRPLDEKTRREIGYLPEERGLDEQAKVEEVLVYLGTLKGLSPREARRRAAAWLERFGLGAARRRKVKTLSKGNQQKVQFIAAVLHDPALVIFDEPFSGFDPVNVDLIREEMQNLKAQGKTILLSSHRMDQVEALVDELILLRRGRIVRRGTVAALRAAVPVIKYVLEWFDEAEAPDEETPAARAEWARRAEALRVPGVRSIAAGRQTVVEVEDDDVAQVVLRTALSLGRVRTFARLEPTLHELFVAAMQEES